MSIQAHSVCILNRTKCIFFPFSSSTQRVFSKVTSARWLFFSSFLRKDRRRGCLCNILHLGTTSPSLFSKHNITAATTLISLCHAWRSAVSFLSKCIVRDIHNIHTFFNIFNHVKRFSGGKSSHRHVILLGSRCGQRINWGRVAKDFILWN